MYDVHSYISPVFRLHMAERVGFEPTVRCRITGFQDRLLKPLGHLSGGNGLYFSKEGRFLSIGAHRGKLFRRRQSAFAQ